MKLFDKILHCKSFLLPPFSITNQTAEKSYNADYKKFCLPYEKSEIRELLREIPKL